MRSISRYFQWVLALVLVMISRPDFLGAARQEDSKSDYVDQLEEAFVEKIERERSQRRRSKKEDRPKPKEEVATEHVAMSSDNGVGEEVIEAIKESKEPVITFLATNEFVEW